MSMLFEVDITKRLGGADFALAFTSDAPVTGLVGPSGVGKTTVLNMISGTLRPDRGCIAVAGRTLFDSASGLDLPAEQRRCGYVFQDDRLFPHMNVRRNLLYGELRSPPAARWASFDEVVALLALEGLLDRQPATLSGGEGRRVAIGRALLSSPSFLVMDEPLTSLDPGRREAMLSAVERIQAHYAVPILYVSHQQDEVARIAARVIEMKPA